MSTFTSDERKILVRYASTLPSGSPERKAVLAGLSLTVKTATKETWRLKDSVSRQDTTLDELDGDCIRAGLKCNPHEGPGRSRQVTVEGSPSAIKKVMSNVLWKNKVEKVAGLSLTAAGYARKSMRGGDYGGAGSSKQLVKDMIANMRRVKTNTERSHAVEQVQHAEAAKSITSQQAKEVMEAIGKTASARRAGSRTAARRLFVVDRKKGVVLQSAPDRGLGAEDLWLWIDEVSEESQRHRHGRGQEPRKILTVMTAKRVMDKWGEIKWAPKRRQDPGGVVQGLRDGVPRTAEDWMEDAVKRPGRLHKFFGIPEDETIPMSKIDGEIAKLKKKDDRTKDEESLLDALNLGKTFKEMKKSATRRTASDFQSWALKEGKASGWRVGQSGSRLYFYGGIILGNARGDTLTIKVDVASNGDIKIFLFQVDNQENREFAVSGRPAEFGSDQEQDAKRFLSKLFKKMKTPKKAPKRQPGALKFASSDDRIALIRYASRLPVGSGERKAILAGLQVG